MQEALSAGTIAFEISSRSARVAGRALEMEKSPGADDQVDQMS
jgi:hypothetical protein